MFRKLIGAIFIIVSCMFFSNCLTDKLRKRRDSLKAFDRLLILLETEIAYLNNPLETAFLNISYSVDLGDFLPHLISGIKKDGIKLSWQRSIKAFKSELSLTDGDIKILLSLSHQLGTTDIDNQVKNIQYIQKLLKSPIDDAQKNFKTLSRLYRSISLSVGIGAIILLI